MEKPSQPHHQSKTQESQSSSLDRQQSSPNKLKQTENHSPSKIIRPHSIDLDKRSPNKINPHLISSAQPLQNGNVSDVSTGIGHLPNNLNGFKEKVKHSKPKLNEQFDKGDPLPWKSAEKKNKCSNHLNGSVDDSFVSNGDSSTLRSNCKNVESVNATTRWVVVENVDDRKNGIISSNATSTWNVKKISSDESNCEKVKRKVKKNSDEHEAPTKVNCGNESHSPSKKDHFKNSPAKTKAVSSPPACDDAADQKDAGALHSQPVECEYVFIVNGILCPVNSQDIHQRLIIHIDGPVTTELHI